MDVVRPVLALPRLHGSFYFYLTPMIAQNTLSPQLNFGRLKQNRLLEILVHLPKINIPKITELVFLATVLRIALHKWDLKHLRIYVVLMNQNYGLDYLRSRVTR